MTDTVLLSFPRDPQYYGVARIVVGGLAAGLSLSYDALDDLQLAIGSLLDSDALPAASGTLTLRIEVGSDELRASLGGFDAAALRAEVGPATGGAAEREGFGLRRMLATIVDGVDLSDEDGASWVTLTKRVGVPA